MSAVYRPGKAREVLQKDSMSRTVEENAELVHFAKGHNFFQQFGKQTLQNRRTHF